jgi:ribose-phosphate pyrophosphokinase
MAESITALLAAGARSEISCPSLAVCPRCAVCEMFVTDTACMREEGWPQLRVISIAPLSAGAVQRFLANGSLGELY